MTFNGYRRSISLVLLFTLSISTFGALPQVPQAQAQTITTISLPEISESEPNDQITPSDQADSVGSVSEQYWQQTISGAISSSDDIDWYSFQVGPASAVTISLNNLPADYDLVLASAANDLERGDDGLNNVQELGGTISAIGGTISAIGGTISAIGGTISAISTQRGTTAEYIDTFLWQPGIYYIAVAGNNGAASTQSYSLLVTVNQSGLSTPPRAPDVRLNITPDPNITTLYIYSNSRMSNRYPSEATRVGDIVNTLIFLAQTDPGGGYLINIDTLRPINGSSETIGDIYTRWDSNRSNPLEANRVARMIDNLITAATIRNASGAVPTFAINPTAPTQNTPPFPNVRHIVLVGGDDIIPFFRVPDLTTLANEADYATYLRSIDANGIIDSSSAQGAALRYRTILTDDIYGADRSYRFQGYPLFIPNRAVGRLVETPAEIATFLAPYSATGQLNPKIDLRSSRSFVAGYDFLIDQANVVVQRLETMGFVPSSITRLINDTWNSQDLQQNWFDGRLNTDLPNSYSASSGAAFALQSVNAHFDHWQAIPAVDTQNTFPAQRLITPTNTVPNLGSYFSNRLAYSVGCHSGFNVLASSIVSGTANADYYTADFAQAFLKQGGNWIGNTGYGYGSLDAVDYSERLSTLFTEELGRDVRVNGVYVGQSIGTALVKAKQRYLRNSTSLSAYDAKALMVMTLYGLPFIPVAVPNPQPLPVEERPGGPADQTAPIIPTDPLGTVERVITFTLDIQEVDVPRTGSRYPDVRNVLVEDSFELAQWRAPAQAASSEHVRVLRTAQAGRPMLPQFAYDISARSAISSTQRLVVKDVSLLSGVYGVARSYDPQITQIVTETDALLNQTDTEPHFRAGAGIWYPDKPFSHSSVGEGEERRDQLVVNAGQFRAGTDGSSGQMRVYSTMVFKVTYVDPGASQAQSALNDTAPPQIGQVQIVPNQTGGVRVTVDVADQLYADDPNSVGVAGVNAIYIVNSPSVPNEQEWRLMNFTPESRNSSRWVADIPIRFGELRMIVQASDKAGNVGFYTGKGTFAAPDTVLLPIVLR